MGPIECLVDQRLDDAAIPVPHAGEVVHRERFEEAGDHGRCRDRDGRFVVGAAAGAKVPRPAAELEPSPIGCVDPVLVHLPAWYGESSPEGTVQNPSIAAGRSTGEDRGAASGAARDRGR